MRAIPETERKNQISKDDISNRICIELSKREFWLTKLFLIMDRRVQVTQNRIRFTSIPISRQLLKRNFFWVNLDLQISARIGQSILFVIK